MECPGPWGRDAVTDNRLPEGVRTHLAALDLKVFLLRRYDGSAGPGTHVFHARATAEGYDVGAHGARAARGPPRPGPRPRPRSLPAYADPLWLVCTNGKRDRCCAELGRPIAGLLAQEWPEGTWETTHLGGHRFSGTLLALPSGLTLGRLDTSNVLAACEAVARGEVPAEVDPRPRRAAGRRAGARAARARRRRPARRAGGRPGTRTPPVVRRRQGQGDHALRGATP